MALLLVATTSLSAFVAGPHRHTIQQRTVSERRIVAIDALEEPAFRVIKGRKVYSDKDTGVARNFAGACLEDPIDPKAGAVVFAVAAVVAFFGFDTATNRAEGPGVGRRRAITWLALQSGAAFKLGPQLTNPCSNINDPYRE